MLFLTTPVIQPDLCPQALGQTIIVEMILCLRVYGIYSSKKVLYFLAILLTICVTSCIAIVGVIGAGHNAAGASLY